MSRFNTAVSAATTPNFAGGEAYAQTPELEFVSILLTSFMKDQYYRKADDSINRIKELIKTVDPLFAAKAALYARNEFGMRSVSHVVAGELAGYRNADWTKRFYDKIVHRPDDMTEIMSYIYASGKKETNPIRKGFGAAFQRLDEYQLAKYKGEGKEFSLIDLVNMVHPKATPAITALMKGTLKTPETWETKLSQAGKSEDVEEAKTEAWRELVLSKKIGYFALLRNLRNIHETGDEKLIAAACALLQNEKMIKKSLVLPFRFYTAYFEIRELQGSGKILKAISDALDISLSNIPVFPGKSLVVVDHSGSMESQAKDAKYTNFQIGALLGAALAKVQDADFMYFGDMAKFYSVNPVDSTLSIVEVMDKLNDQSGGWYGSNDKTGTNVGHGTNFNAVFQEASKAYDRIFIFSDMQGWVGHSPAQHAFNEYKSRTGAHPSLYSFDLSGYGTMQFPEPQVYAIAGFSEKIFDIVKLLEQDKNALINKINEVEL